MSKKEYPIDGYYDFGTMADGPRPSACGEFGIYLQYDHDDVMDMGEYFYEEDPYEMDVERNFGIKGELDEILAESMAAELEEEWEKNHEDEPDEEHPDFYEMAYERMGEMYHCWDDQFKQDCIDYYLAHKDEE